jgi:hypothetical protein
MTPRTPCPNRQTPAETPVVPKAHSVAAPWLSEKSRRDTKEALAPSVRAFATDRGWDEAEAVRAVAQAIDSIKSDG